jgi:hypothetical protein
MCDEFAAEVARTGCYHNQMKLTVISLKEDNSIYAHL